MLCAICHYPITAHDRMVTTPIGDPAHLKCILDALMNVDVLQERYDVGFEDGQKVRFEEGKDDEAEETADRVELLGDIVESLGLPVAATNKEILDRCTFLVDLEKRVEEFVARVEKCVGGEESPASVTVTPVQ